MKVEDARSAEEDQHLNDVFDSESESDQEAESESDQEAESESDQQAISSTENIPNNVNQTDFESDLDGSDIDKYDNDEIEPGDFIIFKINNDIDIEKDCNPDLTRPMRSISTMGNKLYIQMIHI